MRTASFSYVSENQFRCAPINYAGVCLQNTYDYSPFGVSLDGRTVEGDFYRRGFNGMEKDDEFKGKGNSYTTEFRQCDPRLGRWLITDPVVHPRQSPFSSMDCNPIYHNDVLGNTVDPNSSGYADAKEKATSIPSKRGKETNKNFEPEFAKIFNEFENNKNILVKFEQISDKKFGGTISTTGKNELGQTEYTIFYDISLTKELGASALFEETFHLKEAIEGKEMAFIKDNSEDGYGLDGVDIFDEVRAKKWVVENIKSYQKNQTKEDGMIYLTHYGYISTLTTDALIKEALQNGVPKLSPKSLDIQSGGTKGGSMPFYKPMGFGEKYKTFKSEPSYPAKKP